MQHLTKAGLYLFFFLLFTSCGKDEDYTAYFGGEVLNPRGKYLIFSKEDIVIDTIFLDKNNRFFVKFDSLTPSMYSFKHGADYQYIYFEKNDSIMVSVDSNEFDESIVFSGRGEKKNNFMMELFLMHESDRTNSYNIYDYDFDKFSRVIDSTHALRKKFYTERKKAIEWSDDFDFYASSRVNLNYYTKKEYYPYVHARRTGKEVMSKLPKDFYNFRKTIDFNDAKLIHYSPYVRYLSALLNNMAITKWHKKGSVSEDSYSNNIEKLKLADSMFANEQVKNQMLNNIAFAYLLEDQNIENNKKFLDSYMKFSTDDSKTNEIRKIGNAIQNLAKGAQLPKVDFVDRNNNTISIGKNLENETVIFFWTSCAKGQLEGIYDKIRGLKKTHPTVDFIAVNVDENDEWDNIASEYDSANVLQLRAADFNELRDKWVITKIKRTIILNPGGTIKDAFTYLMDDKFEEALSN
ncbi:thioredoxin family protein [Flavobacterium sp. MFBS3-15]|uniref:TlpA family protein disulfide reductase n=1 Tax=Flavobacterium sp. MFBS3-15 TaxID=2989816 RepID=UPI002235C2D6|nr:thioredoxin family protein [Flavobacterium sp. MFBS3-15]MCW4468017.1 thioredoxin family protein [Flavobacterium sp. MFBS3-15]